MLKAGFARLDITPPLGNLMSGYFYERRAEDVLDPLQLNALAFGNGTDTALILAFDVAGIMTGYADEIRTLIAEKTGVPCAHIMLCALHQHTSVCIGEKGRFDSIRDPGYLRLFYRKAVDAAQMALADMSEASVHTAERPATKEIAFVRRYRLEDGSIATNPSSRGPKPVRRCDESDNTVRLLRFKREGKKDIAYVNFSTHPDVISGYKFSADWLGFTRRFVEADHADAHCICVTGFQGDSNHIDFLKPKEDRFPQGAGYAHSAYMGRVIADTVGLMWDDTTGHTGDAVYGEVQVVYTKTNTEGEESYAEQKAFYEDYRAGKFERPPHITRLAYAERVLRLRTEPIWRPVPITVLGLGDIAFVGVGGEPFTYYTRAISAAASGKTVFCSSNSNGYVGYLPHARAFSEGGYESSSSFFTPEVEGQCIAAAKQMMEKF